jgi:hypothetical protein
MNVVVPFRKVVDPGPGIVGPPFKSRFSTRIFLLGLWLEMMGVGGSCNDTDDDADDMSNRAMMARRCNLANKKESNRRQSRNRVRTGY